VTERKLYTEEFKREAARLGVEILEKAMGIFTKVPQGEIPIHKALSRAVLPGGSVSRHESLPQWLLYLDTKKAQPKPFSHRSD
jgi:hypothetical protein